MRKPFIAGNWKMHKTRDEALYFVLKVSSEVPGMDKVETAICPPSPLLRDLIKRQGKNLRIGAQNMYYEEEGAFTGEISPLLLKSYNVTHVIIGHSERRNLFGESDEDVNQKIHAALKHDLKPIVCVGEHLEEREEKKTNDVLRRQIQKAFDGVKEEDMENIVIAYEPIWAIGTGKTATADVAGEACGFIRSLIKDLYGSDVADAIRIQYGGSVKPHNIDELLDEEDIDGALIGGASLDADKFITMANAALNHL